MELTVSIATAGGNVAGQVVTGGGDLTAFWSWSPQILEVWILILITCHAVAGLFRFAALVADHIS
jgi:hypothetical protein